MILNIRLSYGFKYKAYAYISSKLILSEKPLIKLSLSNFTQK